MIHRLQSVMLDCDGGIEEREHSLRFWSLVDQVGQQGYEQLVERNLPSHTQTNGRPRALGLHAGTFARVVDVEGIENLRYCVEHHDRDGLEFETDLDAVLSLGRMARVETPLTVHQTRKPRDAGGRCPLFQHWGIIPDVGLVGNPNRPQAAWESAAKPGRGSLALRSLEGSETSG